MGKTQDLAGGHTITNSVSVEFTVFGNIDAAS